MKILCYFVLIIAFLMFYHRSLVYALIIVVIVLVIFFSFRIRKGKNKGTTLTSRLGGKKARENEHMDDFITLLFYQQLLNSLTSRSNDKENAPLKVEERKRTLEIDDVKREILKLLEEE